MRLQRSADRWKITDENRLVAALPTIKKLMLTAEK